MSVNAVSSSKVKGRPQKCAKGFVSSKNAYMLVYTLATGKEELDRQSSATSPGLLNQTNPKANGIERHGINSSSLENEMISWKIAKRLVDRVNEQNRKFEEWTTEENNKRVFIQNYLIFNTYVPLQFFLDWMCNKFYFLCLGNI